MTTSSLSNWSSSSVWFKIVSMFDQKTHLCHVSYLGRLALFSDVATFSTHLARKRDATFYLCGKICKLVNRLCFRIYQAETVPLENAWFLLLDFKTSEGKFMASDEFLIRLKMVHKVTVASNLKAAGLLFNKSSSKAVQDD